ncbi:DUF1574 family protein [Leptospira langatensis]|uniref:DUF1574 family protein n=1 Tax=Leptospira langatensis TaxID=2484983 RepID=UPI0014386B37|nr:DUF1574 family protein [Leptospira langatensis]
MNHDVSGKNYRKRKFFAFFIPVLILISFLIIDKIFLISSVQEKLAANLPYTGSFTSLIKNEDLDELNYVKSKKVFLAAGTSRSIYFNGYPNIGFTRKDPFLTPQISKSLEEWEGVSIGMAGASMRLIYVRLLQALERGWKPDFAFVEVSMMSFNNDRKYKNFLKQNIIPVNFALLHWRQLGLKTVWEIVFPNFFLSYKYQFSPNNFLRLLQGEDRKWESIVAGMTESGIFDATKHALTKKDRPRLETFTIEDYFNPGPELGNIYREKFEAGLLVLKSEQTGNSYKADPEELEYLTKTILLLKEKGIPTIYWRPRVHTLLNEYERSESNQKEFESKVINTIRSYGEKYVDANDLPMKCNYFRDVGHFSPRCFTELSSFLLPIR